MRRNKNYVNLSVQLRPKGLKPNNKNMGKETLEEAFKKTYLGQRLFFDSNEGKSFELGAKWMQERMYSEEDLREAFRQGQDNIDYSDTYGWDSKLTEQEWFEQFKKK